MKPLNVSDLYSAKIGDELICVDNLGKLITGTFENHDINNNTITLIVLDKQTIYQLTNIDAITNR